MNRREFLFKSLKLSGAILAGSELYKLFSSFLNIPIGKENIAHASELDYELTHSGLSIVENDFNFSSLVTRPTTSQIIIHHSAIGGRDDITAADIDRIHKQNGWSGIGYHMFIRKSGLIETGRPLVDIGAHTYQHNNNSIGICLSGNFNNEMPTDMQMQSATQLIALLCQMYSLFPNEYTIFGHRDFNATACPGDNLYADLYSLRQDASNFV